MPSANNIRLLKNTLLLYIRTIILTFVSLYTSRKVLEVLGVTDLGIYNLVGGIVMLMSFLQGAQVKATSRFIAYELGENSSDYSRNKIYSLCMTIHILISIAVFAIAETLGLWIINDFTNIPQDRIFSANIVYQLSIITFIIQFLRVVFDSVIIAHEEMSIYAYISIIETILQLVLVFVIAFFPLDSLILYSVSISSIAFIIFLCLMFYVRRKYTYYNFYWNWDRILSLKILTFSGWTLLGSSSNTLTQQGVGILMNNFIGLIANTALGFANQINTAVNKFVSSFSTAFNPQIIKYYAQGEMGNMHVLMRRASKCSFVLCYLFSFPLIIHMDYVIQIWLGESPLYVVGFCRMILVCTIIDAITGVFYTSITATGEVKKYNIWISISFCFDLICALLLLLFEISPVLVFGSRILTRGIVNMFIGLWFSRKQINFSLKKYISEVLFPIFIVVLFSLVTIVLPNNIISKPIIDFMISILFSSFIILSSSYIFILKKDERSGLKGILRKSFQSLKNK